MMGEWAGPPPSPHAARGQRHRSRLGLGNDPLSFQNRADFLERRFDFAAPESDLADALDVRELLAAFFEQYDGAREPQAALEQARFVYDVFAGPYASVRHLVLGRQHEERNRRRIEHLFEPFLSRYAGRRHGVELAVRQAEDAS